MTLIPGKKLHNAHRNHGIGASLDKTDYHEIKHEQKTLNPGS